MHKKWKIERKRIIVLGFEGKNNKTESNYFSHFKPKSDRYILKSFSCGVTDPRNMIKSAKEKRKDYDYKVKEDLTFLFVDCDCDKSKSKLVDELQSKQEKDLIIIKSNPCFELWFLNHFCKTTKEYKNNNELIKDLHSYLQNYEKNKDYFLELKDKTNIAIGNSKYQLESAHCGSYTETYKIIDEQIIIK
jgi:hypothetical protein